MNKINKSSIKSVVYIVLFSPAAPTKTKTRLQLAGSKLIAGGSETNQAEVGSSTAFCQHRPFQLR
jgi:hypothetical protein